eukprot:1137648-Pelagomonas_calceolata.AAC.2
MMWGVFLTAQIASLFLLTCCPRARFSYRSGLQMETCLLHPAGTLDALLTVALSCSLGLANLLTPSLWLLPSPSVLSMRAMAAAAYPIDDLAHQSLCTQANTIVHRKVSLPLCPAAIKLAKE